MDTGMSVSLEALIAAHPDIMFGLSTETGHWEAVRRPAATSLILDHAPTLEELAAKLAGEAS